MPVNAVSLTCNLDAKALTMKSKLYQRSFANQAFGLVLALLVCVGLAAAGERSLPQRQPMHKTAVKDTTAATTPKPIIDRLNAEFVKALRDPQNAQKLEALGLAIAADSPEGFTTFIAAESQKWRKVVIASGAKAD